MSHASEVAPVYTTWFRLAALNGPAVVSAGPLISCTTALTVVTKLASEVPVALSQTKYVDPE